MLRRGARGGSTIRARILEVEVDVDSEDFCGAHDDLVGVERLGEVLVRPGRRVERPALSLRREDDDVHTDQAGVAANGGADVGAVHPGHHHVEQDQVGLQITRLREPADAVLGEVDLDALEGFFEQASVSIAALGSTCTATEQWGELSIEVASGVNVVELAPEDLQDSWGVTIRGPADAELYINASGPSLSLDGMVWSYLDGVQSEMVLLDLPEVTDLDIVQGDHHVNMLAPNADVSFPSGLVTGNLVAASLSGGGQINCGHFRGSVFP